MSTHDCDTIQTFGVVFTAAQCPRVHVLHNSFLLPVDMWGISVSGHCNLAVTPTSLRGNVRALPKPRSGLAGQRL